MKKFILKEQQSFSAALNGIKSLIVEKHFAVHLCLAIIAVAAGLIHRIDQSEWIAVVICITIVLAAEATNTAIEKLVDYISLEITPEAKVIKDIGAGMVLLAAIGSFTTGILIFCF